jgi:hypothetical protein
MRESWGRRPQPRGGFSRKTGAVFREELAKPLNDTLLSRTTARPKQRSGRGRGRGRGIGAGRPATSRHDIPVPECRCAACYDGSSNFDGEGGPRRMLVCCKACLNWHHELCLDSSSDSGCRRRCVLTKCVLTKCDKQLQFIQMTLRVLARSRITLPGVGRG